MLIKKIKDIPATPVQMEDAKDVSMRVLFGPEDKVPTFSMRLFEFAPAGNTPYHTHEFEHEVIVLDGQIMAVMENKEIKLNVGNVAMVMPREKHQFRNISDISPASMICLVPAKP